MRKIIYGIQNIIWFLPTIWKIRAWDYSFFYLLLSRYLRWIEVATLKHSYHANAKKEAHRIRYARVLAERLWKDGYLENALLYHNRKWGEELDRWVQLQDDGTYIRGFSPPTAIILCKTDQEERERNRCYAHADYLEKQDYDQLFDILYKRLKFWWS